MRLLLSVLIVGAALVCAETRTLPLRDATGWTDLTTLKGWTRVPIPATAQLNPQSQWRFDPKERVLICEGDKGHEMLRSDVEYGRRFVFHVEWRFKPIPGDNPRYNSGVFVLSSDNGEYFTQGQTGAGPVAWLFSDYPSSEGKKRLNLRDKMTAPAIKPPGDWNTFEMLVNDNKTTLFANGQNLGDIEVPEVKGRYVGLEAEGFYIEFRNVKVKQLLP